LERFETIEFQILLGPEGVSPGLGQLARVLSWLKNDAHVHGIEIMPWVVLKGVLSDQMKLMSDAKRGDLAALALLNQSLSDTPSTLIFDVHSEDAIERMANKIAAMSSDGCEPISVHLTKEGGWLDLQLKFSSLPGHAEGCARWRASDSEAKPQVIGRLLRLWEDACLIRLRMPLPATAHSDP
jgi:hypothetical protein